MTAQDATKAHKNAKARRERRKQEGSPVEEVPLRKEGGGVTSAPPRGMGRGVSRYLRGVMAEMKRVSWPSKPELIAGTITTLFVLLVFSGFLGSLDYVLRRIL